MSYHCIGFIGFVVLWRVGVVLGRVIAVFVVAGFDKSTASKVEQTYLRVESEMCALGRDSLRL